MRISFSTPYAQPFSALRPLASGDEAVQAIAPVTRGTGEFDSGTSEPEGTRAQRSSARDTASFSPAALDALKQEAAEKAEAKGQTERQTGAAESNPRTEQGTDAKSQDGSKKLTDAEQEQVRKLKTRDAEVRAHEAAHAAAAGSLASGGASYDYERGPDGANYAVGGEVGISVGGGATPEERASNAAQAQRAANAPANPSGADRAVAAKAAQAGASARAEIAKAHREESKETQPGATQETSSAGRNGEPSEVKQPGKPDDDSIERATEDTAEQEIQQGERQARSNQLAQRAQAYGEVSGAASARRSEVHA